MQTFIKSGNTKLWLYVGILVLMAGLWRSGEAINSKLANLPIKTAPKASTATATIDQKSFYAVWVKRLISSAPEAIENDQAVEDLFRKKDEAPTALFSVLPEKPPGPDYVQLFKQQANISGFSDDGIFINNRFYAIGQALESLAMAGEAGKPVIPVLKSIQKGKVTFSVDKQQVVFLIGKT
jgi:hypothetical protein